MTGPKKAIGYVRVSSDRQVETGLSLEAQRQQIVSFCIASNVELVHIAVDAGVSGGKDETERAGLQEVLAAVSILLDTAGVSRMHPDRSGVTTTAHEFIHAVGAQQGLTPGDLKKQDTSGSAAAFGESVAQEKPDIPQQEAAKIVDDLLSGQYKPQDPKDPKKAQ